MQTTESSPPEPDVNVPPSSLQPAPFRRDAQGRFVNLDGTGRQPLRNVFKWWVTDRLLGRRRKSPPHAAVPAVEPDRSAIASPPVEDGVAQLVWLGHASWLIQVAGLSLVIDPALYRSVGIIVRRNGQAPLAPADLPPITAQLVTHNHADHMDLPSLRAIGAPVIAGLGTRRAWRRGPSVTELGWWESKALGRARITFVPSQHWSQRGLADHNRMLWGGFIIQSGGLTIYHSGDTAFDERTFALIGSRFPRIDVALLPIGAYDPEWFMCRQHMSPAGAVQAFTALGARRMLAMHWGTFKLTDEPLDEPPVLFRQEANARGIPPDIAHIIAVGERVMVRAGAP